MLKHIINDLRLLFDDGDVSYFLSGRDAKNGRDSLNARILESAEPSPSPRARGPDGGDGRAGVEGLEIVASRVLSLTFAPRRRNLVARLSTGRGESVCVTNAESVRAGDRVFYAPPRLDAA